MWTFSYAKKLRLKSQTEEGGGRNGREGESVLSAVRHEIFVGLMFLAHLWVTGYAAAPELRIHRAALFYKYLAAPRLGAFTLGFGAKPREETPLGV